MSIGAPPFDDADLEKIGVSLGHRRKILAAVAELVALHLRQNMSPLAPSQQLQSAVKSP